MNEQLADIYLVEMRDLNAPMRIASKIPPARIGSIQVRPVRELNVALEEAELPETYLGSE